VLEEVAKSWKNRNGGVIVDGEGNDLKNILKNLEGSMSGGRIVANRELSRQNSLVLGSSQNGEVSHTRLGIRPSVLGREDSQPGLGMSVLDVEAEDEDGLRNPRKWLKVIDAFEQPRLIYNVAKKHFDRFVFESIPDLLLISIEERPQTLRCYPQLHTKHMFSETDIISSTNVS
jgi:DNA polymerase epsilon subunit 2